MVVAEAGASPLEPYNGDAAVQLLGDRGRCTVLCASDPYAVVGVTGAFDVAPGSGLGPGHQHRGGVALLARPARSRRST